MTSGRLRLLVVDHEPSAIQLIRTRVEPFGCDVLAFGDSRQVAPLVETTKFHGAFLDAEMPHFDGLELTRQLRASVMNRQLPIVILTGLEDSGIMREGFKAGATFFLGKPLSQERVDRLFNAMRGPMQTERRRSARVEIKTPVQCKLGERNFKLQSANLGESGMLLDLQSVADQAGQFRPGKDLHVEFELPGQVERLKLRAVVVRPDAQQRVAVAFLAVAERQETQLRQFLNGAGAPG